MKGKVVTFENLTELRLLQEEMKHHDRLATLQGVSPRVLLMKSGIR